MKLPYYEVSAFTTNPFGGNPAGVCVLDAWLPDAVLLGIAANNNLAETAFVVPRAPVAAGQNLSPQSGSCRSGARAVSASGAPHPNGFGLRWFTPTMEVDLCGHATLAAAAVLFRERGVSGGDIRFETRSGRLTVTRDGAGFTLDFPARPPVPCDRSEALIRGLGAAPQEVFKARDYLAVFSNEAKVRALQPDFFHLKSLDCLGVIASAPGTDCDFVSRFFAPGAGIDEDPVTGSAHCTLIPYWAARLGKTQLNARQISARGGELTCELIGGRVRMSGQAAIYLRGEVEIS